MLSCTSKAPGPPLWLRKTIRPPSGEFKLGSPAEGAGWKRRGADRRACFRAGEQPIIRSSQGRGDSKELGQLANVNADRTMNPESSVIRKLGGGKQVTRDQSPCGG